MSSLSFPVGHDANILRKTASMKMVHHPQDVQNIISYPLRRMVCYNVSHYFLWFFLSTLIFIIPLLIHGSMF